MSVITFPDLGVASFRWRKAVQAVTSKSIFGSQSIEVASPLWECDLGGVSTDSGDARQIEMFLESFDGFKNQVALWNLRHPIPAGTMRGAMTLSAPAAQGATSITITAGAGQAGKTLLKGDFLGLGSGLTQQVVPVAANATANGSGVIVVSLAIPLRAAHSAGASVTWDKPTALFRQKDLNEGLEYTPDGGQPWTLSLIEDVKP